MPDAENQNSLKTSDPVVEEYKQHLFKVIDSNSDRFEKQLSYISAGSLGVSMAFIKDVVGSLNDTRYNWLIVAGWIAMVITLLLNLVSQVYANECHAKTVNEIDCGSYDSDIANRRRNKIVWMNYISIGTLILGIVLLLIFISKNI